MPSTYWFLFLLPLLGEYLPVAAGEVVPLSNSGVDCHGFWVLFYLGCSSKTLSRSLPCPQTHCPLSITSALRCCCCLRTFRGHTISAHLVAAKDGMAGDVTWFFRRASLPYSSVKRYWDGDLSLHTSACGKTCSFQRFFLTLAANSVSCGCSLASADIESYGACERWIYHTFPRATAPRCTAASLHPLVLAWCSLRACAEKREDLRLTLGHHGNIVKTLMQRGRAWGC